MKTILWGMLGIGAVLISSSADAGDGAKLYHRCAACHLASGEGVPSSYPPLAGHVGDFMGSDEGRAYLVAVITKGVMGPMDAKGETYRGMMPAQAYGLKDEDLASLLNHLSATFGDGKAAPFTTEEVTSLRAASASLTPKGVLEIRPSMGGEEK